MKHPCPCCACNPGSHDGDRSGLGHLTLAEEAQAHANWAYIGCPNSERLHKVAPKFEIKWFDKKLICRGDAWYQVAKENDARHNRWVKCHTRRTWCWVRVLP